MVYREDTKEILVVKDKASQVNSTHCLYIMFILFQHTIIVHALLKYNLVLKVTVHVLTAVLHFATFLSCLKLSGLRKGQN
jgi:hypothetical protein